MRTALRITTIIALGAVLLASSAFSFDKTAVDLTVAGVGARPLAMGKAFTALADDCNAVFLNPAGLGFQKNWELTSLSTRLLDNVDYKMVGAKLPTRFGTLGVGLLVTTAQAGYTTTTQTVGGVEQIIPISPINFSKNVLYIALGHSLNESMRLPESLGKLSVGGSLKAQSTGFSNAIDAAATGLDADASLLWQINPKFSLGLNAQNVLSFSGATLNWSTDQKEKNESRLKLGGALRPDPRLVLALDADFNPAGDAPLLLHGGAEDKPVPYLSLRLGVDQNPMAQGSGQSAIINSFTAGVGVEIQGFKFDYAYYQDPTFNAFSTHYFSMSFAANQEREKSESKPVKKAALSSVPNNNYLIMTMKDKWVSPITKKKSILEYYK